MGYVCIGQASGKSGWEPTLKQRIYAVYGSLVPSAILAASSTHVGAIVALLGSIGGCPEIVVGPLLLVAFRHVGSSTPRALRYPAIAAMISLMALLWASSIVTTLS